MISSSSYGQELATMLIPFDAIFDTRSGTIAKFGMDVYRGVQMSGYYSRRSDHFHGVNPDEYRKLYRERDAVTLSVSPITHMVSVIKDFARRVNDLSATSPVKKIPRIDVNTYPFNTPDHINDKIRKALFILIKERCDINFVSYSPTDLHYDLVKFTYDHLVLYDIGEWISAQAEDWNRRGRAHSELSVFMPILCFEKDEANVPNSLEQMAENFERDTVGLFNPIQLPVMWFSQIANPRSDTYSAPETEVPEVQEEVAVINRRPMDPTDWAGLSAQTEMPLPNFIDE